MTREYSEIMEKLEGGGQNECEGPKGVLMELFLASPIRSFPLLVFTSNTAVCLTLFYVMYVHLKCLLSFQGFFYIQAFATWDVSFPLS